MAETYNYILSSGTIVPDTGAIQTAVQLEYQSIFGSDLIVNPNSPQGLLISSDVLARSGTAINNASIANQINPNLAGGIFLDAILQLTGMQRQDPTYTTVVADLAGVPGTFIPAGTQARETDNNVLFESVADVTLAIDGTASTIFRALEFGAIPVGANKLTQIVSVVLGWDSITNPLPGNLGTLTQSDAAARTLRRQTLFKQGTNLAGAMMADVRAVANVSSLTFRENTEATSQVVDGVTMVANSVYACVRGGTDDAVALALTLSKSGGAAYNNGASASPVTVNVTNPYSGQVIPVKFDRPDLISMIATVTISISNSTVPDPQNAVRQAILDYANGLIPGEPGLIVGQSVSSFELSGAIAVEVPGVYVRNLQISKASPVSYTTQVDIEIWEQAYFDSTAQITVVVV